MKKLCNYCDREVAFNEYGDEQHAVLRGNSHAELWENSHAELRGNSHAELRDNSHAVLWDNSHAELWDNSHAVLRDNSHAVLRGNSHAELWDNSHANTKSPYACAILKSKDSHCMGRHIGDKPLTPKEYLSDCGIDMEGEFVILYKSVRANFASFRSEDVKYIIGSEIIAPDWDKNADIECGKGLHLSPTVQQARSFNNKGLYLACRVRLSDIANLPSYAKYPDKIRVRACVPLYQVDIEGKKVSPDSA